MVELPKPLWLMHKVLNTDQNMEQADESVREMQEHLNEQQKKIIVGFSGANLS